MKVNVEVLSSVKRMLHVEVPLVDVKEALDGAYSELKKTVKIKGFRHGRVPRSVLEVMYKKDVHKNVTSQLIQKGLSDALAKERLKFVGSKEVDLPELNLSKPYCFNIEIEVKPDIEDIKFKGLILKKMLYKVNDEEISTQLGMLQKNIAKKEPIQENRSVMDGDFVVLAYKGFKDGKYFVEAGKSENFTLKVGTSTIDSAFDKSLEGMKPGEEKKITITFPNDYENTKLSGLEVVYEVKVKDILEEILPDIDDNMAKQLGPFKNLDELKNKILDNLQQGYRKRMEQELNEQIFTQLIEKTEFELPEILINYELDAIIGDAERSFNYHGKSFEEVGLTRETLREKYKEVAKKQVRRGLILGKIIEQEKMIVSDTELKKGLEDMSKVYDSSMEKIENFYRENPDKLDSFKHALLEKRVIDIIVSKSVIEELEPEVIQQVE